MYKKRENDEFKLLVFESYFLAENTKEINFSQGFPPELSGIIGAVGTSALGVGAVFTAFSGMSGASIMATLASFGLGGAVGGIVSIVSIVAFPAVLVGGSMYGIANQRKLKSELVDLIKQSYKLEDILTDDERKNVQGLLITVREYRNRLMEKHKLQNKLN
ncbi:hypothetical protein [Vagococcus fluvialis]|uniref:hypothetical protein n=1 Tax=Vagococcus fluvialis TaxID=2738 RepID=UPI003B5A68AD